MLQIDSVRLSIGGSCLVALAGAVNTISGLPRSPAVEWISRTRAGWRWGWIGQIGRCGLQRLV